MIHELKHKLDLQLFGANDGNPQTTDNNPSQEPNANPKTYSEEEYLKLKSALSKANSEASAYKKQLNDKMSEDEKAQEILKAEKEELERLRLESKINNYAKTLSVVGLEEKHLNAITESLKENDIDKLCKELVKIFKEREETLSKKLKDEFNKSSIVPSSSGSQSEENLGTKLAKAANGNNNSSDLRKYFGLEK